jgi:hypothetical protein
MLGIRAQHAPSNEYGQVPGNYRDINPQTSIEDKYTTKDDSSDSGEEWERFEALKGTEEDRRDEEESYLFENDVEKTWEKGGSGLVFYTVRMFIQELHPSI